MLCEALLNQDIYRSPFHKKAEYLLIFDCSINVQAKVRETLKKAYWDGVMDSVKKDKSNYSRVVELTREVSDEISAMAPKSWRQEIIEAIDLNILTEVTIYCNCTSFSSFPTWLPLCPYSSAVHCS